MQADWEPEVLGSGGLLLAPNVLEDLLHDDQDALFVAHRLGKTILMDPYTSLGSLRNADETSSPVFSPKSVDLVMDSQAGAQESSEGGSHLQVRSINRGDA